MKALIVAILLLTLTACASTPSPLTGIILRDYEAAQSNFEEAAKLATPGSVTERKLTAAAECMRDNVARLTAGNVQGIDKQISGLISAGSAVYIDVLLLEEKRATRAASSESCDQLTGQIVRGAGSRVLRTLPSRALD